MLYEGKTFTLKDGRQALLRSPQASDAAELAAMIKKVAEETDFILRTPEESTETPEKEALFIERCRQSPDMMLLVCEVDGLIAGDCEVSFSTKIKLRHRAHLGIAVLREFWNLGIGTAMIGELIRAAGARPGVTRLDLDFLEGNVRGQRLYEKMGFRVIGLLPDAIRLPSGKLLSEIHMARSIP